MNDSFLDLLNKVNIDDFYISKSGQVIAWSKCEYRGNKVPLNSDCDNCGAKNAR